MLIAQISDFHLRADGVLLHQTVDSAAALANCVAHVNRLDPRPDVVLATGDLADEGRDEDYRLLRRALDALAMPYYVIPGNHDDRGRLRRAFADHGYLPADGAFLHYTIENYSLRLIALDTVIEGEVGGGLCTERLAWLAARLAEQPARPTLIFMHHPPFPTGIRFMDTPFEGAAALEALIRSHPQVRQVVCGHMHRAIHLNWAGTCAATAPSTVFQMNLGFGPEDRFAPVYDPPAIALYLWRDGVGPTGYISLIDGGGGGGSSAARDGTGGAAAGTETGLRDE
jgi:3',5'-cyclic AMP phosphodiesterase CpdA